MRHDVTGNSTDHNTDQPPTVAVHGGPPVQPSSVTVATQDAVPVQRAVCGWCGHVLREGSLPETTGICPQCSDREIARLREARAHLLPLYVTRQEPAGTYRIEDRDGRMLARNLPGSGIAAAMAVRLEDLKKSGEGWCPKHVPAPLREGRCVSCALHLESSQWAVNR